MACMCMSVDVEGDFVWNWLPSMSRYVLSSLAPGYLLCLRIQTGAAHLASERLSACPGGQPVPFQQWAAHCVLVRQVEMV